MKRALITIIILLSFGILFLSLYSVRLGISAEEYQTHPKRYDSQVNEIVKGLRNGTFTVKGYEDLLIKALESTNEYEKSLSKIIASSGPAFRGLGISISVLVGIQILLFVILFYVVKKSKA